MSNRNFELEYRIEKVLPYLKELYYSKNFQAFLPGKMYLVGSRGRTPLEDWSKLEGKDWDILIEGHHLVVGTEVWGKKKGYYMDIVMNTPEIIAKYRKNNYGGSGLGFEIFPNTPEEFKKYLDD